MSKLVVADSSQNTEVPGAIDSPLSIAFKRRVGRRSFIKKLGLGGAALAPAGAWLGSTRARADHPHPRLTPGDAAILRFLAAAEILETDLWQQYTELALGNESFQEALEVLDEDMPTYVNQNTRDEFSHQDFINAYLVSKGRKPVDLEPFRTLPSSQATGAQQIGRLTNLMQLTVDTSYWTRYRSDSQNPDFGDVLPQAVPGLAAGQFPAIPRSDDDLSPPDHLQAIANTAGFHFAFIEQGGTSLYAELAQRVTHSEVLRILLSIGGTEIMHFQTWQDKAGNAPPLTDGDLVFPDLNADGELTQTNLIMPEPTAFLKRKFPPVSIIRPTETKGAAVGAATALTQDGLFIGQTPEFFAAVTKLARAADAARPKD